MRNLALISLAASTLLISACDTSIGNQVEKRFEKTRHDALSPTTKIVNTDESKTDTPQHGVALPELSGDIDASSIDQSTLIPVEQFSNPQQSKLKNDALKWQEANLEKYNEDGSVILIHDHPAQNQKQ